MTSDNIAEYVGENNQFTEKPVTEYPPVIQDNTVTTKDYLYSNNIDTDLLVVIGGLIVILFLMMLIMYFINYLRHKELTEILEKYLFLKNPGAICLNRRRSAVICCPCVCWHRYSVHPESWQKSPGRSSWRVRRKLHGRRGAVVLMVIRAKILPGLCHRSLLPISMISSIKRPVFLLTVAVFMNRTQFWITVNGYAFLFRSSFRTGVTGLKYCA
ncbi:hypothetical protein HmCmsJML137_02822 [Escherichia coli]|nr:hypothetical protein HmCmsJML137_02822 [Escherichia coli]